MRGPVPRMQPTPVRRHLRPRCISRSFGYVTQSAPLEHALELLFTAAEMGAKGDRKAAECSAVQVKRVLEPLHSQ